MKRGIIILGIILVLVISGCKIQKDKVYDCMINPSDGCSRFDLNRDNFVNILDFVIATSSTSSYYISQSIRERGADMTIQSISSNSGAGTLEIYTTSTEDIYGFQFSLTGLYVSGASGGIATSNGYMFSTGCDGECVVGFNFGGDPIPTSSMPDVLVVIAYSDHYGGEVCFKEGEGENGPYNIVSADEGVELATTWNDGCGGEGIIGCNDPGACNYDADVTIPDGSCIYETENFDCDGNCIATGDNLDTNGEDCNGDCGGSALVDNCGVCDIYPANDDSTCNTGCMISDACNYNDGCELMPNGECTIPCTTLLTTPQENPKNIFNVIKSFFRRAIGVQKSDVYVEEVVSGVRENECCAYPDNYPDNVYDCDGNCILEYVDACGICEGDGYNTNEYNSCDCAVEGDVWADECGVCNGDGYNINEYNSCDCSTLGDVWSDCNGICDGPGTGCGSCECRHEDHNGGCEGYRWTDAGTGVYGWKDSSDIGNSVDVCPMSCPTEVSCMTNIPGFEQPDWWSPGDCIWELVIDMELWLAQQEVGCGIYFPSSCTSDDDCTPYCSGATCYFMPDSDSPGSCINFDLETGVYACGGNEENTADYCDDVLDGFVWVQQQDGVIDTCAEEDWNNGECTDTCDVPFGGDPTVGWQFLDSRAIRCSDGTFITLYCSSDDFLESGSYIGNTDDESGQGDNGCKICTEWDEDFGSVNYDGYEGSCYPYHGHTGNLAETYGGYDGGNELINGGSWDGYDKFGSTFYPVTGNEICDGDYVNNDVYSDVGCIWCDNIDSGDCDHDGTTGDCTPDGIDTYFGWECTGASGTGNFKQQAATNCYHNLLHVWWN